MSSRFHLCQKIINFRSFHNVNSQGKLVCTKQGEECGLLLVSLEGLSESKITNNIICHSLTSLEMLSKMETSAICSHSHNSLA